MTTPSPIEFQLFAKRARFYNDVLGVLSVSLAFGALGTDAPRMYAVLGALFILAVAARQGQPYERLYRLWREVEHPFTRVRASWRFFLVFIVGWAFLGMVALGILTKHGLVGFD